MIRTLSCLPLNCRDAVEAAIRLRKALPLRDHRILDEPDFRLGPRNLARKVRVGQTVYGSVRRAARANGISLGMMYNWCKDGRAEMIEHGQVPDLPSE